MARLNEAVVFGNAEISAGCVIDRAIVCSGAVIDRGASIEPGCVIGPGCKIPAGATVPSGVRLSRDDCERIFDDTSDTLGAFSGYARIMEARGVSDCIRIGSAVAEVSLAEGGTVGVMYSEGEKNQTKAGLIASAACDRGAYVMELGCGFRALAELMAGMLHMTLMLFVSEGGAELFDRNGLPPSRPLERSFAEAVMSADCELIGAEGKKSSFDESLQIYRSMLAQSCPGKLCGVYATVVGGDEIISLVFRKFSDENGAHRLLFNFDNHGLTVSEGDVCADLDHVRAIILKNELENGLSHVILPYRSPRIFEKLSRSFGATLDFYSENPSDSSENELRRLSAEPSRRYLRDPAFAAVRLAAIISERGKSLSALIAELPHFGCCRSGCSVPLERRAGLLSRLGVPGGEGIIINYHPSGSQPGGCVRVIAGNRSELELIAEAASMELAGELVERSKFEIRKILERD